MKTIHVTSDHLRYQRRTAQFMVSRAIEDTYQQRTIVHYWGATAIIGEIALPLPPLTVAKIATFADTGIIDPFQFLLPEIGG